MQVLYATCAPEGMCTRANITLVYVTLQMSLVHVASVVSWMKLTSYYLTRFIQI